LNQLLEKRANIETSEAATPSISRNGCDLSVIIPTFDSLAVIDRAIDSVLGQTLPPREVIVVDDGSRDSTYERLDRRGGRVTCIRQPNAGPSAARNRGAAAARGAWLAFLDADDTWEPDKIEIQFAAAMTERAAAVFSAVWECSDSGRKPVCYDGSTTRGTLLPALIGGNVLHGGDSTLLIRRDVFERLGGFDVSFEAAEDRDLFIRLVDAFPVTYLRRPLVQRFRGPIRYGNHAERNVRSGERIIARHAHRLIDFPDARRTIRQARARVHERAGLLLLEHGRNRAALHQFARAACLWPLLPNPWKAAFNVLTGRRRYPGPDPVTTEAIA